MEAHVLPSKITGRVEAPQSKSIAIRLLFAGLLGDVVLDNLHISDDVASAMNAITVVKQAMHSPGTILGMLDVHGSGTTLRMLLPVLAFLGMECELHGDQTLERRPLGVIRAWLEANGAQLSSDHLPLRISGRIETDSVEISGSESSQYISGIIYGLLLTGGGKIRLIPPVRSSSYIEMTCSVLISLGCSIRYHGMEIDVGPLMPNLRYHGEVPGDFLLSSFYAISSLLTGGSVEISGLSNPQWSSGDSRIVDIMRSCGADSFLSHGTWRVSGIGPLTSFKEDVEDSPDMAVSLAALSAGALGESVITGTNLLEIKESNRILSISRTLEAFGLEVSDGKGIVINNTGKYHQGIVADWKDHRIAMLGTVLAMRSGGLVRGAETVSKSNPQFFDDMAGLGGRLSLRS